MKARLSYLCLAFPSVVEAKARHHRHLNMEGAVTDRGYDSYATAWRYLGAYVDDCSTTGCWWNNYWYCTCQGGTRKLLWAAYHDPEYKGDQIGEYQYYTSDGEWDDSTCTGDRCAKMDCHDPDSSWELLGVYKETVSFDDYGFFEQLFKHQGYCLWDGDKEYNYYGDSDVWQNSNYWFMQAMRKELPEGCENSEVFYYYGDSSPWYIAMKPQEGGNMTLGVYTDSSCTTEADYTYKDYQYYAASSLTATASYGAFDTWNANMDAYKICQPCRAYNREETECSGCSWRRLGEEGNGHGDEERNGFNCYDSVGYQNCNQCYKFETRTDMEEASASDLSLADSQGTILLIQYDGVWYGSGVVGDVEEREEYSRGSYRAERGRDAGSAGAHGGSDAADGAGTIYSNSLSFAGGAALLALGGALVGARRRGALDDKDDDVYVEMAASRSDYDGAKGSRRERGEVQSEGK